MPQMHLSLECAPPRFALRSKGLPLRGPSNRPERIQAFGFAPSPKTRRNATPVTATLQIECSEWSFSVQRPVETSCPLGCHHVKAVHNRLLGEQPSTEGSGVRVCAEKVRTLVAPEHRVDSAACPCHRAQRGNRIICHSKRSEATLIVNRP
jgi:hypothetical protein